MRLTLRRGPMALTVSAIVLAASLAPAEQPDSDCGPPNVYQKSAAWSGYRNCPTGLGQSRAVGPKFMKVPWNPDQAGDYVWETTLAGPFGFPVINQRGTIYVPHNRWLTAVNERTGAVAWHLELPDNIWGAPAIAFDGGLYAAGLGGQVYAIKTNGTLKWTHVLPDAPRIATSVLLGPGRRIYTADDDGFVTALVDKGTHAEVLWRVKVAEELYEGVAATPALSPAADAIYVATEKGRFKALRTKDGALLWKSDAVVGENSSPVVDRNGYIYIGGKDGTLRSIAPGTGNTRWTRSPAVKNVLTPVIGPNRTIWVHGQDDDGYRLFQYTLDGAKISEDDTAWPQTPTTLLVDEANQPWVGNSQRFYRAMGDTSTTIQHQDGGFQDYHAAMSARGAPIVTSRTKLSSLGTGTGAPDLDVQPIVVAGANRPQICAADVPGGPSRPGVSYKMVKRTAPTQACPAADKNAVDANGLPKCVMADVTIGQMDSGCPVEFCNDAESEIAFDDGKVLIGDGKTVPSVPSYPDATCERVGRPVECKAIDRTDVKWSATQCVDDTSCSSGYICANVCKNGNQTTGAAPATCEFADMKQQCVKLDSEACAALPAEEGACHELRECAADNTKLTAAEAEPVCYEGTTPVDCDAETVPAAPLPSAPDKAQYKKLNLWSKLEDESLCSLGQSEKGDQDAAGGRAPDSGKNKKKKWGLTATGKANVSFDLKPLPFGLFKPVASALADFNITAIVLGNAIKVIGLAGKANLDVCAVSSSATLTIFNQDIDAANGKAINYGDDDGYCQEFFYKFQYAVGDVKKAFYQALRIRNLIEEMKDVAAGKLVGVTKSMCYGGLAKLVGDETVVDPLCDNPNLTKDLAVKVVNGYITKYENMLKGVEARIDALMNDSIKKYTGKLAQKGISVSGLGFQGALPIMDLGQQFSIVGAKQVFPIGPVALVLEIQGTGGWGVDGALGYTGRFAPAGSQKVGLSAKATIAPHANVDVDVFLGAGYDFGIGGAAVGFGGHIRLVEITAPIVGETALELNESTQNDDAGRLLPVDFGPVEFSGLASPIKKFTWKSVGKIGAMLRMDFLYGELDVRLRVYFAFFKKTWKKRIAKLPGVTKTFEWTGSFDLGGKALPGLDLPTLPTLPQPKLPRVTVDDFDWGPNVGSIPWPSVNSFPTAVRNHVDVMNAAAMPTPCQPPAPL